jgi:predicted permease
MFAIALFQMYQHALFAMSLILDGEESDFKDLGKLMLAGFVLALGVGIAFTVIRMRLRDKRPPTTGFISINSFKQK